MQHVGNVVSRFPSHRKSEDGIKVPLGRSSRASAFSDFYPVASRPLSFSHPRLFRFSSSRRLGYTQVTGKVLRASCSWWRWHGFLSACGPAVEMLGIRDDPEKTLASFLQLTSPQLSWLQMNFSDSFSGHSNLLRSASIRLESISLSDPFLPSRRRLYVSENRSPFGSYDRSTFHARSPRYFLYPPTSLYSTFQNSN